jgi:hypothetical protein
MKTGLPITMFTILRPHFVALACDYLQLSFCPPPPHRPMCYTSFHLSGFRVVKRTAKPASHYCTPRQTCKAVRICITQWICHKGKGGYIPSVRCTLYWRHVYVTANGRHSYTPKWITEYTCASTLNQNVSLHTLCAIIKLYFYCVF